MDFKISCLLFIRNKEDEVLMIRRRKAPNKGRWSPPGGSWTWFPANPPLNAQPREAREETGLLVGRRRSFYVWICFRKGLRIHTNWLMFLFDCKKLLSTLPPDIDEGRFCFYSRHDIDNLKFRQRTTSWFGRCSTSERKVFGG